MVFMKGTPEAPQCGFSRAVCQILDVQVSVLVFRYLLQESPSLLKANSAAGNPKGPNEDVQLSCGSGAEGWYQGVQVSLRANRSVKRLICALL